jgi:hypothetical protein
MLDEHIRPYVPEEALRRPEGAAVDDAGLVTCVGCQMKVPVAKTDIVGLGYRCVPCGTKASISKLTGGGDAASHFTDHERSGLRASGGHVMWGGAGVIVLGVVLLFAMYLRTGTAAVLIGIITMVIGFQRRKASE